MLFIGGWCCWHLDHGMSLRSKHCWDVKIFSDLHYSIPEPLFRWLITIYKSVLSVNRRVYRWDRRWLSRPICSSRGPSVECLECQLTVECWSVTYNMATAHHNKLTQNTNVDHFFKMFGSSMAKNQFEILLLNFGLIT